MRTSCVQHSKSEPLVILRGAYVELCDHDHAAACLLAVFEYWHNVRLAQNEQERIRARDTPDYRPTPSQWIHKSYEDLARDLLGLPYGRTRVITATQLLVRKDFLTSRSDRKNPNNRTKQYHFRPDNVNAALAARESSRGTAQSFSQASSATAASRARPVLQVELRRGGRGLLRRAFSGGVREADGTRQEGLRPDRQRGDGLPLLTGAHAVAEGP
jgi:hypothetical protein